MVRTRFVAGVQLEIELTGCKPQLLGRMGIRASNLRRATLTVLTHVGLVDLRMVEDLFKSMPKTTVVSFLALSS